MRNIHVLPTDKPSRLYSKDGNHILDTTMAIDWYISSAGYKPHNIYITSEEEIKEGDWFIWKDTDEPYTFKCIGLTDTDSLQVENSLTRKIGTFHRNPKDSDYGDWYRCYSKKIILTTDQDLIKDGVQDIDDEFLEWFVENPSYEEVNVEIDYSKSVMNYSYKIIIPKEETKLKNICIKCGVDLYATEGRFECQKHPKECKGVYLSEETLLIHAAEQKQHLIDMMKADEELGLYKKPKFVTVNMESATGEDLGRVSYIPIPNVDYTPKQETLEERIQYISFLHKQNLNGRETEDELFEAGILAGIEETKEIMYSEEEVRFIAFQFHYEMSKYMKVPSYYMPDTTIEKERIFEKFKKK